MTSWVLTSRQPWLISDMRGSGRNAVIVCCAYVALYVALDWISLVQVLPGLGSTLSTDCGFPALPGLRARPIRRRLRNCRVEAMALGREREFYRSVGVRSHRANRAVVPHAFGMIELPFSKPSHYKIIASKRQSQVVARSLLLAQPGELGNPQPVG